MVYYLRIAGLNCVNVIGELFWHIFIKFSTSSVASTELVIVLEVHYGWPSSFRLLEPASRDKAVFRRHCYVVHCIGSHVDDSIQTVPVIVTTRRLHLLLNQLVPIL